MIRVLHLRDTHEIGGPGKTILETHRLIDADRFELHLGVFQTRSESGDGPFIGDARRRGMPVHLVRGYNQYDPRMLTQVAALGRRLGIDVIHAHEFKSDFVTWLAAGRCRARSVTTLHGWIGNGLKQRLYSALDKRIVRRFDRVIAVSERMRQELLRAGVPAASLRVLRNAIVLDRYRPTGEAGRLRRELGLAGDTPVVASLGRLSPEKGHADLVAAAGILARQGRPVALVLLGEGPERERLGDLARRQGLAGQVHLPGHVPQPQTYLEDVDLMVLPSHTEGLPNAALEALAMGVPVLATDVGGTSEVIRDGQTGRLVAPRSPDALAAGIAAFLADRDGWRILAARGRRLVEESFDFRVRTRKLEEIYAEVAALR